MLFYQLMSRRYETASTVLASNKGFEEWGEVFGDDVMATALVDRLLHHCHVVNIRGNSYRSGTTPSSGQPSTHLPSRATHHPSSVARRRGPPCPLANV